MSTRSRPRRTVPVTVALVLLVLAACTATTQGPGVATLDDPAASGEPAPSGAAPSASVDPEQAMLDFARCMRENGVDMPDPQTDGNGRGVVRVGGGRDDLDPETMQKAQEACQHIMAGIAGEGGPRMSAEQRDAMLEFAKCMRENGVDMPDPQFDAGGGRVSIERAGNDPGSPEFRAAQEACGGFLGGVRPASPAGPDADDGGPSSETDR